MAQVRRRRRLVQPPEYNDVDERRCEVQGLASNILSSHLLEIGGGSFRDASSNSDESEEGEETQDTEYDDDDEVEDEETEGETEQSTSAELLAPTVRLTEKQQWEVTRSKIIIELKSPTSHVNVAILSVRSTKKEKCTTIWKKYAPEFEEKKVVASVARLLTLLAKKEGHFSESSDEKSSKKSELIWKTRS